MNQFIRNFNKQRTVGILNICGLSLGIMVSVIVGLWAINELSFDKFHKDKDKIHRIAMHIDFNNTRIKGGGMFKPVGEIVQERFPQIDEMIRIFNNKMDLYINEKVYPNVSAFSTDKNFFTFFSFQLKEGDPETVLDSPNKIVISENASLRYFADQDPIGQTIEINGKAFTVSGIMKNMPKNSSIQADIITPFFGWMLNDTWLTNDSYLTFIKLQNKSDIPAIEEGVVQIYLETVELFKSVDPKTELEPLEKIHFGSDFMFDPLIKGNKSLVLVFILVALIILIISCINFTNLFISTSFLRAKTVGIKKSQGADTKSLVLGFYIETACYILISVFIGLFLAYIALPVFNNFTQSNLSISIVSAQLYVFLVLLFFFTVFIAGTFPAFYITRFNPIETLFGKFKGKNVSVFQKALLIFQFTASISLLIVIGFMNKQVNYMISQDLGFDKENVIYVHGRGEFGKSFQTFKHEMLKDPSILDVTRKNSLPNEWQQGWPIKKNTTELEEIVMEINRVQDNYFDFMDIDIVLGENPFFMESNDSIIPIMLNEKAVEALGLENPIGEVLSLLWNKPGVVSGVIEDIMVQSFHKEVFPQIYMKFTENLWERILFFKFTGDPKHVIAAIQKEWEKEVPDFPFEYHFLDDTYKQLYASEVNAGKVLSFAMLISFIISITGLFAMSFYMIQRRVREIALRKVNGATMKDLFLLLNKDFILWTSISFIIACPVAYFSLQKWLEGFVIKAPLNIWLFLLVGIVALSVTLLTTSFQTWKIASANPVKSLKNE